MLQIHLPHTALTMMNIPKLFLTFYDVHLPTRNSTAKVLSRTGYTTITREITITTDECIFPDLKSFLLHVYLSTTQPSTQGKWKR